MAESASHPAYSLKLPIFEGPLDLLLHLVKVNEMDIYDIHIADITRQYMDYLNAMQELDLEVAGDYLVMAATLLNLKSRSLLPARDEDLADEEEIDEIMSTRDLIRRLVEYRKFKELANELRSKEEENSRMFYRANVVPVIPGSQGEPPRQDVLTLFDAFTRVLQRVRQTPTDHHINSERFTTEEKMTELREKLRLKKHVNMTRVFETCSGKDEVVCLFLAVLEMAKLREITLAQAGPFEDIMIEPWEDKVIYVG